MESIEVTQRVKELELALDLALEQVQDLHIVAAEVEGVRADLEICQVKERTLSDLSHNLALIIKELVPMARRNEPRNKKVAKAVEYLHRVGLG